MKKDDIKKAVGVVVVVAGAVIKLLDIFGGKGGKKE